jgi:NADPH-dependent curcumin reductase
MIAWLAQGKIKIKEEAVLGMQNAPAAMIRKWKGDKFGKLVVKVNEN